MIKFIRDFVRDDAGASAAEYALILAIVGSGIAAASLALGTTISNSLNASGTCISSKGQTC
ncbi:Flp family type IVb pilin (plasmid) [Sphingobium sp. V4]|uniref:Flp family type IVb pilin n=1 Tax=Sphingobium sp. V4 TaxID=3038927 RepID=UPI00255810F4|nr:Flp family type IVb pilin [Sphingobium sp. V4]WIW90622.1 Flp family type IVb pilin [Sphingobium sp. V4]